ncbi:unnamed protein product [Prunus armeniaca]
MQQPIKGRPREIKTRSPKKIKRVEGGGASTRARAQYTFEWGCEKSCVGLAATTRRSGQIEKGERESKV